MARAEQCAGLLFANPECGLIGGMLVMWNNQYYDSTMIIIYIILYNTNDNDHERILLHVVTCCTKKNNGNLSNMYKCIYIYINIVLYIHYIITILIDKTIPVHII